MIREKARTISVELFVNLESKQSKRTAVEPFARSLQTLQSVIRLSGISWSSFQEERYKDEEL